MRWVATRIVRNKLFRAKRKNRSKILLYERRFETKQNFVLKYFEIFFIVTHLCHHLSSKALVMMENGRSMCLMRLSCKACSSHGISPIDYGLVSSVEIYEIAWISKGKEILY